MSENYDWTENQKIPGVMVNPGTGPVHNATRGQAAKNVTQLVADVLGERSDTVATEDTGREDDGRFTFVLRCGERTCEVDMPGLAVDEVRFMDGEDQNIWDFPRLYVEGSSWVWSFAISQTQHYLFGEEDA